MSQNTDARPAVQDLLNAIRGVFAKYTRSTREKAWDNGIQSADGRKAIDKLIKNPKVPIVGAYRFLKFKEWINR